LGNEADVFLRKDGKKVKINITSKDKPEVGLKISKKWQRIIDLMSEIYKVAATLIMKIESDYIKVFMKDEFSRNPYNIGQKEELCMGLYCETVLGKKKMFEVKNALKLNTWKDNPDIGFDLIYYMGVPIRWPDGELFGTLCILDDKERNFKSEFHELMLLFRDIIEEDLNFLVQNKDLKEKSRRDLLTEIWNHSHIIKLLEDEMKRAYRYKLDLSVIIGDIDNFKDINDNYGHYTGDIILKEITQIMKNQIRVNDKLGRYGGEEFLLVVPNTDLTGAYKLAERIRREIDKNKFPKGIKLTISFGMTSYQNNDALKEIINRADTLLYKAKKNGKNKSIKKNSIKISSRLFIKEYL